MIIEIHLQGINVKEKFSEHQNRSNKNLYAYSTINLNEK